jgi:hypothetical protein
MSVTYFGVDMLTFNPVGSKESYKGNLLKKWFEMQAESSKRAEQALETYWGEEAKKNKTCPSNYSYYFVKETPGAARYQLIRDRSKSPDKTQVGAAHSRASRVATGAIEMAGGVMTALRMKPEVVAWIQENLDMDIANVYFKAIDDMIDATKRFEKAEDALIQAFDQIEKEKEVPLDSVIPKGLEI